MEYEEENPVLTMAENDVLHFICYCVTNNWCDLVPCNT